MKGFRDVNWRKLAKPVLRFSVPVGLYWIFYLPPRRELTHGGIPDSMSLQELFASVTTDEYNNLGQVAKNEVEMTTQPNVFAQIGVIEHEGIFQMLSTCIDPPMSEKDCFVDLGSGIGNVCFDVYCNSRCGSVIGVEVLPSRHNTALAAKEKAYTSAKVKHFFEMNRSRPLEFLNQDLVGARQNLVKAGASVVFTHSWMFDDALMAKVSSLVSGIPTIRCVVSSRPLGADALKVLPHHAEVKLKSDWNADAPFHVYSKFPLRTLAAANAKRPQSQQ